MSDNILPFPDRLTPKQTAQALGVSPATLAVWRCTGRYALPFYRVGSRVYYARHDVEAFIASRRIEPTTAA